MNTTARLHELVLAMDAYADRVLSGRFGADHNLFAFLSPLHGGPLDVTRLAASLNLSKAAVSKRVPLLQRDGWVGLADDPGHGRRVLVSLTPKGRDLVEGASVLLNGRFATLLDEAGVDAGQFGAQLARLIAAVRALPEEES